MVSKPVNWLINLAMMALIVIVMAQVRNVNAQQPLNLIAWLVVALMVLTLVACHEVTRDLLRQRDRDAQPPP